VICRSKVALVVEGEPDVAEAIGLGLIREDYTVVRAGSAYSNHDEPATGNAAAGLTIDVSDVGSTETMARDVVERFGRIDVLVNAGGYRARPQRASFAELAHGDWDRCFAEIVRGTWLCCRAVVPSMKQRRSGRIITVGSTAPWSATPGFLQYATAASALIGMTRSLARELGGFGISVNMVCLDPAADAPDSIGIPRSSQQPAMCQAALPGRVGPEDVVGPVLFLAGAGSEFITGQSYLVNGGTWVQ
jgi:NAD(P)-dependent dehydrogenase (short-subunit alcohol dehydrogenase family)